MPKLELTSHERSTLRATAHPLRPVVLIGDRGLSPSVLNEIDRNLVAHELIKVRIASAGRDERETMLDAICEALSCAAVHHLGKTLIIYRPDTAAQQAAAKARNTTRALRKPSAPYIPKKQAASTAATSATPRARHESPKGSGKKASRPEAADSQARHAGPASRTPRRPAAPSGIPRRSSASGSALTLRAGARRGRATRS